MAKSGGRTKAPESVNRSWHLSRSPDEIALTELEYSLFRVFESFVRWQMECVATASGSALSGADAAILNVVRMRDRPKGISDIARLLNRDDIANLQYSLRKLAKAGLVEKAGHSAKKDVTYQVTARGRTVTETYARIRGELLMPLTGSLADGKADFDHATRVLSLLTGMYDQAARMAATYRPGPAE